MAIILLCICVEKVVLVFLFWEKIYIEKLRKTSIQDSYFRAEIWTWSAIHMTAIVAFMQI
jgi:hypothetical protein